MKVYTNAEALNETARMAREAGMTYGRYVAKCHEINKPLPAAGTIEIVGGLKHKRSAKAVNLIDEKDNIIKQFVSLGTAEKYTGVSHSTITTHCNAREKGRNPKPVYKKYRFSWA